MPPDELQPAEADTSIGPGLADSGNWRRYPKHRLAAIQTPAISAAEITRALDGRWYGAKGSARCPSHEDRHPSLSITETGGKVLIRCFAGCSQDAVIAALAARGLWPSARATASGQHRKFGRRHLSKPTQTLQRVEREALARCLWSEAQPIAGTPAERYLQARGITGELPCTLRYLPARRHRRGLIFPALVAAVQHADGQVHAIQITYLATAQPRKAGVTDPRETVGPLGDGAVRLALVSSVMGLAEGTESAISAMRLFNVPCWSTLGAARLDKIAIPDRVGRLVIFADADQPGQDAARRAAVRYRKPGREVLVETPPAGDWNDALAAKAGLR